MDGAQPGRTGSAPFAMAALNAFFASYSIAGIACLGMKDVLAVVLSVYAAFYGLYYLLTLHRGRASII